MLVVVTESLVVGQFKVEGDGGLSEISKVKMSTRYVQFIDEYNFIVILLKLYSIIVIDTSVLIGTLNLSYLS